MRMASLSSSAIIILAETSVFMPNQLARFLMVQTAASRNPDEIQEHFIEYTGTIAEQ